MVKHGLQSHFDPKLLPDFESFTIEEEEGSGNESIGPVPCSP